MKGRRCEMALKGGDAQRGALTTKYECGRPTHADYNPMRKQGGLVLGTGGDNSDRALGIFYEGAMYGNFDIILGHFSRICRLEPRRAIMLLYALPGAYADWLLIGAWNPMLWPIWGFRWRLSFSIVLADSNLDVLETDVDPKSSATKTPVR